MNLRYKKIVFKLNIENEFLMNTKIKLEKKNDLLKTNFDVCQIKNELLEKWSLNLKMKFEKLMNERENFLNNSIHVNMTKCTYCKFHGHSVSTCPIKRKAPYRIRQV
ncbi:hypothetical protein PTKIN_Ptkin06aG0115300 [Pterospermum kingtungense]